MPNQPQAALESRSQPAVPSSFGTSSQHGTVQGQGMVPNQGSLSVFVPPPSVGDPNHHGSPQQQNYSPQAPQGTSAPQLPLSQISSPLYPNPPVPNIAQNSDSFHSDLSPSKPVFGVSLEDLLRRDGSAIPLVVYQCIQAVDLFGLDVEGIYRLSGSSIHVSKLRDSFNAGMSSAPGDVILYLS